MGFDRYCFVPPVNHSEVIVVLWNNNAIHATVSLKEHRAIHMLVHDIENLTNSTSLGIYVPVQTREKNAFWEHLLQLHDA